MAPSLRLHYQLRFGKQTFIPPFRRRLHIRQLRKLSLTVFKSQICQSFNTKNKKIKPLKRRMKNICVDRVGQADFQDCPYPAGEMKQKMPRGWESGSFNWNLTQFPASKGGEKSTDTRWSNKIFVPSFMLSVASSFHLVGKGSQYFTGIVSKIQISDFCRRNRHNSKGFFVFFDTRCTNLKIY